MPGDRGPRNVPMIPLADSVALSTSVSNHSSRKSAALMVISLTSRWSCSGSEAQEVPPQAKHAGDVAGSQASGIRRDDVQQVLDRARHVEERAAVVVVGLGIAHREAGDLAPGAVVVAVAVEAVAVRQRSEGALERQDGEPVTREVQFADDIRAHQADHVREHAVLEARKDLLGDGGASQQRPRFEHAYVEARAGQVGRVHEAVVPAADHDHVVFACHRGQLRFLAGSKNGVFTTVAGTLWRTNSTVSSTSTRVPGPAKPRRMVASAMYFLRIGEKVELVA